VLQCVAIAVFCSVSQCVEVRAYDMKKSPEGARSQHVAASCSVMQRVAVSCGVLQCVAVSCSVLQCLAVSCSVRII